MIRGTNLSNFWTFPSGRSEIVEKVLISALTLGLVIMTLFFRVAWTIRDDLIPLFGYAVMIFGVECGLLTFASHPIDQHFRALVYHPTNLAMDK